MWMNPTAVITVLEKKKNLTCFHCYRFTVRAETSRMLRGNNHIVGGSAWES